MESQTVVKGPDAFRTISEVAEDLDLPQHVLRFWETRFTQIKPMKRGGGRRYYRPEDVELLRGIRVLLYGEGFTIRGVQRLLKEKGVAFVAERGRSGSPTSEIEIAGGPAETLLDEQDLVRPVQSDTAHEASFEAPAPLVHREPTLDVPDERSASSGTQRFDRNDRRLLEAALSELSEVKRMLDQSGAR